ncbi:hypothetical protein [Burkholderia vietnamiensis]|uniref:hypothetical protein n=1 Tax=Burkholderia vietnamiensis TaxID=60552 RepID=UPI0007522370|nr:hypothetical protein [Burkholderia vietnamiensis]KVE73277.1 hypothetical protein WI98_19330 [Burkholderia vietnamiensis]KVF02308.1 hypothetical protein WJ03_05660 [Burkholderia vietnamiensis]KVF63413.1 hypothetical protein WJ17_27090 [Burkholderia vietnamiensis]
MSRLLLEIMSRTDEQKVLTVLGAVASFIAVYLAFGIIGASIEVAVLAAIAVVIALSRKA